MITGLGPSERGGGGGGIVRGQHSDKYIWPFCTRKQLADALKPDEEIAETGAGAAKGNAGGRRLQELLKLGGIRACVAEWIPYGRNYLAFLNEKLGSGSKVPGGLFTSELDEEPDEEVFVTTQEQVLVACAWHGCSPIVQMFFRWLHYHSSS